MTEPNTQATESAEFDAKLESELDAYEGREETPEDSSSSKETQESETEETEGAGDDQQKTSEPEETKEEESKEDKAKDPVESRMFRKAYNEASKKYEKELASLKSQMLPKEEVENIRRITSSPSYIQESMRSQGYKDEAIDSKLKELGHNVPTRGVDDVGLITRELGLDPKSVTDDQRQYIGDIAKVSRVMMKHMMGQELPGQLKPFKDGMEEIQRERGSSQVTSMIQKTIKDEGVLDYEKDVEPEMNKWLDSNEGKEGITQEDFLAHFKEINHRLSIERLRTGKRREDRGKAKDNQRPNKETLRITPGKLPERTGDFNKDIDGALDALGIMS